ncbi:MAG: carboxypeptidase regulatory-like domain-containing protein [Bryobacteraceae bacterium]|nr:carboxypeptidase regulatory-like domain-containing protein [Bryobacteraceae bacterium]MDW8376704.1 carboxypeptidase-like regulatory domain-containing protein [Bryobacterales bacterium]
MKRLIAKTSCILFGVSMLAVAQPPSVPPSGQPVTGGGTGRSGQSSEVPLRGRQRSASGSTVQREPVKPEDFASVEGIVTNAISGEPLSKASVTLRPVDGNPGEPGGFGPSGEFFRFRGYSAQTDSSGRFTIPSVEPGKYRLSVTRSGFVDQDYGSNDYLRYGPPLTLAPKQHLRELNIKLTPHAVITGRIVDEDGEPMVGIQVEALRNRYSQGKRVLSVYRSATTNDLGEYRIYGLPPGSYLVAAAARRGPRPPSQAQDDYVTTFFPGATDPNLGTFLNVAAGQQASADLRLRRQATYTIKGRLSDPNAGEGRRAGVFLTPRGMSFSTTGMRPAIVDGGGNFEIRGVPPGAYFLVATSGQRGRPLPAARFAVEVSTRDVEVGTLTLQPPLQLTGRLLLEAKDPMNLSGVQVRLTLRDPVGALGLSTFSAAVKPDGTFTFDTLAADQYTVALSGLPDGYYVKHARFGNQDAFVSGVDLRAGSAMPLEISLSPNAGRLAGTVFFDQQQVAGGATVVLVPVEAQRREQPQFYKTTTSGEDGQFTISNIEPGQYRVFAWKDIEAGAYMDPDFLRPVEGSAEIVSIKESASEQVRLRVIQ